MKTTWTAPIGLRMQMGVFDVAPTQPPGMERWRDDLELVGERYRERAARD